MNAESMPDLPVAVLMGGVSPEREISLRSGEAVATALETLGAEVHRVDPAETDWWTELNKVDVVFIALHGPGGEDGVVQGALQTWGVPYTGSGVLASALAMDKVASKRIWQALGMRTPDFRELRVNTDPEEVINSLGPVFVKPADGGSSIGVGGARNAQELLDTWERAVEGGSNRVIAEQWIEGPEYTVSILNGRALPPIRVETDNDFYDYDAKYESGATRYICPCELGADEERELVDLSLRAFDALGCEVWGRVDLVRDGNGRFWLLEVNTVPGMTDHSLVPMAARAQGLDMSTLVGHIILVSVGIDR